MCAPKIPTPPPPPPPPAPPVEMTDRIKPTQQRRRKLRSVAQSGVSALTIPMRGTSVGVGMNQ